MSPRVRHQPPPVRPGLVALLTLASPLAAQHEAAYVAALPARPLFADEAVLPLTLRGDFRALLRDRDTVRSTPREGVLTYHDEAGSPVTLPVTLRTRGNFRLRPGVCDVPPLRIDLAAPPAPGTIFQDQRRLKVVTTCRSRRDEYEQFLLQEHLLYRIYNRFTPLSFRARLARVAYEDAGGRTELPTRFAILLEDEDEMAARNGGTILEQRGALRHHLDTGTMDRMAVFQFLIANVDWSVAGLHNVRLVRTGVGRVHPVPYDFDWSGVIGTPYAAPGKLPIRSVRDRLYRGHCVSLEEIRPAMDEFVRRRDEVFALVEEQPGLRPEIRQKLRRSFDEFYATLADPVRMERELRRACLRSR